MIHINVLCDEEGCIAPGVSNEGRRPNRTFESAFFDSREETWGGMLDALAKAGWRFEMTGARVTKAICPACGTLRATP